MLCLGTSKLSVTWIIAPETNCSVPVTWVNTFTGIIWPFLGSERIGRFFCGVELIACTLATGPSRLTRSVM